MYRYRKIALIGAVMTACASHAQADSGSGKPIVQVIDPMKVSPLVMAPPFDANGPAAHRRVVTHAGEGAVHLDIGYNTYKKGTKLSIPYAYKTDEYCFSPGGKIRMQDAGEPLIFTPGMVMWRPAGGVTRSAEMLEDTATICAMSPARRDANSHRVAPEDVGKWSGDPAQKPIPHYYSIASSPDVTAQDKTASAGVVEREVVSKRKDGSDKVSVIHTTLPAGAHLAASGAGEQICWLESGSLELTSDGQKQTVPAQRFFYRPEGVAIGRLEAVTPATMICLTGPAAL